MKLGLITDIHEHVEHLRTALDQFRALGIDQVAVYHLGPSFFQSMERIPMKAVRILDDIDSVANEAAKVIAAEARSSVETRGQFVMAVSGGRTPWQMLRALADENVPWDRIHVVQVDERIAPAGDADRNLTHLQASLLERAAATAGAHSRDAG